MPRSLRSVSLDTYHGAFVIALCIFDWSLCMTLMFVLLSPIAQSHRSIWVLSRLCIVGFYFPGLDVIFFLITSLICLLSHQYVSFWWLYVLSSWVFLSNWKEHSHQKETYWCDDYMFFSVDKISTGKNIKRKHIDVMTCSFLLSFFI
jgi:hypothetical protein